MARIRTIKPEFFTSEDIVGLSPLARLLYIALWCESDREGRLEWKPRTLKMKYLPAEPCEVSTLCTELINARLVVTYDVDGQALAVLPTFKKHQHINMREAQSTLPPPPNEVHVHARAKDAWMVSQDVRDTVLARDGFKCVRCGATEALHIDHIFPISMGGTNALTNLRVLCQTCNCGRPVAGQAFIDDLAKDGLTLDDMQRTCMHVQVSGEGKGREGKGKEGVKAGGESSTVALIPLDDGSDYAVRQESVAEFTAAYPRIDVIAELAKARAWCLSNPKNRKTRSGASRFLNSWMSRANDRAAPSTVVELASQPGGGRRRLS